MGRTVNHRAPHITAERPAAAVQCYWCWAYNRRYRPAIGFASFLMRVPSLDPTQKKEAKSTNLPCCVKCLDNSYAAIGQDYPPYWSYFTFWRNKDNVKLNQEELKLSREALIALAASLSEKLDLSLNDPDTKYVPEWHTDVQTIAICHAALLADYRQERREAIEANILDNLNLLRHQLEEKERSTL